MCGEMGVEGIHFMCGSGLVGRAGHSSAGGRRFDSHLDINFKMDLTKPQTVP